MELTDLQKLESTPKPRQGSDESILPSVLYVYIGGDVELQNHFDQSGFAFTIPARDDRERRIIDFDESESVYLYQIMINSFGSPTFSGDSLSPGEESSLPAYSEIYLLTSGNCLFEVEFSYYSFTVEAMGRTGSVEGHAKKFKNLLHNEINKLKRSNWLETIEPESATYFENPFNFYFEQGREQLEAIIFYDRLMEEIEEIKDEIYYLDEDGEYHFHEQCRREQGVEFYEYYGESSGEVEEVFNDLRELKEKQERLESLSDKLVCPSKTAAFLLFIASFEGLLNLIYEIYLFKELREDERIKGFISRAQIDIKLRAMPVYCSCFKGRLT